MSAFRKQILGFWLTALLAGGAAAAEVSDLAREQRLREQIVDAILDGEPVDLAVGQRAFLGIYTEAEEKPVRGAAIVLHGRGFHPDWADVAAPLRVGLAERGWHTLSLQMPVLGKDAKYYDYLPVFPEAVPRIEAGIDFLRAQGVAKIALVAHSCGVHMSMAWFERHGDARISAYVGIGMGATDYRQPMPKPFPLARFKVPVLDLYGSADFPAVGRLAPRRWAAMQQAGHPGSRQVVVDGADHYFHDRDEDVLEPVAAWLAGL